MTELKKYSVEEVQKHNQENDAWIIIKDEVYNITKFLNLHPAGKNVLLNYLGKDASEMFNYFHSPSVLFKYEKLKIGSIEPQQEKQIPTILQFPNSFGDGIPFGDPNYIQGWNSPYYKSYHLDLRKAFREFIKKEIEPFFEQWEEDSQPPPRAVIQKCAQNGMLALCLGTWPTEYFPEKKVCGVTLPQTDDIFCESIMYDELSRLGSAGFQWGITGGTSVGLPPIIKYGSAYLKQKVIKDCLTAEKLICLAITEPWAGSDVANIQTTAKKSPCGKFYLVNGLKKWITNGIFCDYFTTAVRTGGTGMGGISMLLIEKEFPGVQLKKMKCQGMWASGTTFIIFDNVKVPVENLIGKEGDGFNIIMINFNHERLLMSNQAISLARLCVEESMKFAHKRKTFGKRLIDHPVIRNKLGHMIRQVESAYAYMQVCLYNYGKIPQKDLSGAIALLKVQGSQTVDYCAREAVQIFGGLGYSRGGQGGKIERIYREVKFLAVPGGSEEILIDLGVRQASKNMPKL